MGIFRTEGELRKGRIGLFLLVLSFVFLFGADVMMPLGHGFPYGYVETVRSRAAFAMTILSVVVLWPLTVYFGVASIVEAVFARRSRSSTV